MIYGIIFQNYDVKEVKPEEERLQGTMKKPKHLVERKKKGSKEES